VHATHIVVQGLSPGGFVATISISLVVQFLGICLVVITFGNSISSSILRDGVWMPTGWKHNTTSPVWNTACSVWYSGVLVIVGAIYLSGQLLWGMK
jgi:hypothetical protein